LSQVITARFNGIPCTAEYSLTLGVSAGSGSIEFSDISVRLPHRGTLLISDSTNTISLANLYVDKPRVEGDAASGYKLSATVHDRRYAWQWGMIFGVYNQLDFTNTPKKEKTLQELIQLCLWELGENIGTIQLIDIPVTYPSVQWEPENPATALDDLCDEAGLVIGINTAVKNNPIVICPYDKDRQVPPQVMTNAMEGVSSAIKPKEVYFVGGRDILQVKFGKLVPVGEDIDGGIKKIDDLSYAPDDWGVSLGKLFTDLANPAQIELADKSVFKWYAIDFDKHDAETVLPLLTEIVDTIDDEGVTKRDKPYILGTKVVWDGVAFVNKPNQKISDGFSLDKNLGLVKFNEVVVKHQADGLESLKFEPAVLTLVAAHTRKASNGKLDFFTRSKAVPGGTEIPVYYEDSKVVQMYKPGTSWGMTPVNYTDTTDHADNVLKSLVKYYVNRFPKMYTYPGIFNIGAWGSIRNVVWRADPDTGASTEIHKDMEIPKPLLPDFTERQMRRKFKILWKTRKDTREVRKEWPYE
jgi:hypothetical protein